MRLALLALLVAAPAHAWEATALPPGDVTNGQPLAATVTGVVEPLPGGGFAHVWPGIVATARFEGRSVVARFDDPDGRYELMLDGQPGPVVTRPGRNAWRIDGLGPGTHTITLAKISENAGTFAGFSLPAGGTALPPPPPGARQIEIVGDSDSVGYGNISAVRDCGPGGVFGATDTRRSYGPTVARRSGADLRLVARSGIGVVRNFAGSPGQTMPQAWAATPRGDGWDPQVVVVALGSNDFAVTLAPDEPWSDAASLRSAFATGFEAFLADIRARYPRARILVMDFADSEPDLTTATLAAIDARRAAGDPQLAFGVFPALDRTACDWHPSLADHAAMADALDAALAAQPDVWQGR